MRTINHPRLRGLACRHVPTLWIALGIVAPAVSVAQGIAEPWDVTIAAQKMALQAARLEPLLDQITPLDWQAGPATATYIRQLQSTRDEVRYLVAPRRRWASSRKNYRSRSRHIFDCSRWRIRWSR